MKQILSDIIDSLMKFIEAHWVVVVAIIIVIIVVVAILNGHCSRRRRDSKKKNQTMSNASSSANKGNEDKKSNEDVKSTAISSNAAPNSVQPEKEQQPSVPVKEKKVLVFYFPINKKSIFLKIFEEMNFESIFEAKEKEAGIFEFSIISVEKVKAWDISDAATNVGTVLQQDAVDFETKEVGIAERKVESGKTYWLITKKTKVEYKK